jgi:hypothetical protein
MRSKALALVSLGVLIGLVSVSCGRRVGDIANPAAPDASATTAAPMATVPPIGYDDNADVSASGTVVQTISLSDRCNDNRGIRFRFWEAQGRDLTGRFTKVFNIRSNGGLTVRLACLTGRSNCVGATTNPAGGGSWGVGLNGDGNVSKSACRVCASNRVSFVFICSRGSGFLEGDEQ